MLGLVNVVWRPSDLVLNSVVSNISINASGVMPSLILQQQGIIIPIKLLVIDSCIVLNS